jgi:hypothetical protein
MAIQWAAEHRHAARETRGPAQRIAHGNGTFGRSA